MILASQREIVNSFRQASRNSAHCLTDFDNLRDCFVFLVFISTEFVNRINELPVKLIAFSCEEAVELARRLLSTNLHFCDVERRWCENTSLGCGWGGQRCGPLERKEICSLQSGIIGCPRAWVQRERFSFPPSFTARFSLSLNKLPATQVSKTWFLSP